MAQLTAVLDFHSKGFYRSACHGLLNVCSLIVYHTCSALRCAVHLLTAERIWMVCMMRGLQLHGSAAAWPVSQSTEGMSVLAASTWLLRTWHR